MSRDLARSGSKTVGCGVSGEAEVAGFGAASQPIVGKPDPYALRAEAGVRDVPDTPRAEADLR